MWDELQPSDVEVVVFYEGVATDYQDVPHGNAKHSARTFHRAYPSALEEMREEGGRPKNVYMRRCLKGNRMFYTVNAGTFNVGLFVYRKFTSFRMSQSVSMKLQSPHLYN